MKGKLDINQFMHDGYIHALELIGELLTKYPALERNVILRRVVQYLVTHD